MDSKGNVYVGSRFTGTILDKTTLASLSVQYQVFKFNINSMPTAADLGIISGNANYLTPFGLIFGESENVLYHFVRFVVQ